MSIANSARIHPTAIISANVEIGENVEVGAFAVIDGNVKIGPDCVIRPGAYIFGNVIMGRNNQVFTGAVLGEEPQHLKYNGEPTGVEIGDNNIFREHVTIHRGTTHSMVTRIGNNNFIMANSHVAHDCVIGNHCILANGALLGGHAILEDNVYLSGNCGRAPVHPHRPAGDAVRLLDDDQGHAAVHHRSKKSTTWSASTWSACAGPA